MGSRPSLIQHGGWPFLVTSMIGRQPAAMVQMGLLLYVASSGLGLDLGGLTVAAIGLGTACGASIIGRLVDRFGPFPVVVAATVMQATALLVIWRLTFLIQDGDASRWWLLAVAFIVGMVNPQVGPIARSRWSHLSRQRNEPALVRHALGFESAMDEFSFIIGPVGAGVLVGLLGPSPALLTLIGIIVVGQGVFAVQLAFSRGQWGQTTQHGQQSGAIPWALLGGPMVTALAIGTTFGATQTALTAINEVSGTQHLTGIIYGSMGVGSVVTSLLIPHVSPRFGTGKRLLSGGAGLLIGGIGLAFLAPNAFVAVGWSIFMGLNVGILLVTTFARAEQVAPSSRMATVMTILAMCLTLGVSIGAALTGQLAENLTWVFAPMISAGVLALASAVWIAWNRKAAQLTSRAA